MTEAASDSGQHLDPTEASARPGASFGTSGLTHHVVPPHMSLFQGVPPAHLSRDPVVTVQLPEIASTNGGDGRQRGVRRGGGGSIDVISDAVGFSAGSLIVSVLRALTTLS